MGILCTFYYDDDISCVVQVAAQLGSGPQVLSASESDPTVSAEPRDSDVPAR